MEELTKFHSQEWIAIMEMGRERNKYLEFNDAQILLEYLKNKQIEDPIFFYAIELDQKDSHIANFFGKWSVYYGLHVLW
jgi:hypothetical protein